MLDSDLRSSRLSLTLLEPIRSDSDSRPTPRSSAYSPFPSSLCYDILTLLISACFLPGSSSSTYY